MVYIAADNPLPPIEWQADVSYLSVSELREADRVVIKQFTKPFVYFAGAYTGCSCGFEYGQRPIEDEKDKQEDSWGRRSVSELSEYISNAVRQGSIEMFACWSGGEEDEPEERLSVAPDYFGGESFAFKEDQFIVVCQSEQI